MNWISIIGFASIGPCVLMAGNYAIGRHSAQQKLLILLFLSIGSYQLHEVLVQSGLIVQYTFFLGWGSLFPLLIAPLLYLYVQSIITPEYRFRKSGLLHFLPFVVAVFSRMRLILESPLTKAEMLRNVYKQYGSPETDAFQFGMGDVSHFLLWHLQPLVYFILVLVIVIKAKNRVFSVNKLADWLMLLSFGLLFYFISDYLTEIYFPGVLGKRRLMIEIPLFSFLIFALCLMILQMSPTHTVNAISKDAMLKPQIHDYFSRLQQLLIEKKLYLKPELQLADLANELGLNARDLSVVIRKSSGSSYTDFINKYRVKYSQELMNHPEYESYKISAIGEASGFKSKDAFYRAFKKVSGVTPKVFQNTLKS